ncbi:MAG: glycosyltransferase [Thermoplasmata archaeon]
MVAYTHYPQDPRVRREAESLVRAGIPVTVVCLRAQGEPAHQTVQGVNVDRVPLTAVRGGRARYLFQYAAFILLAAVAVQRVRRRARVTDVHVHSVPDFLVFVALPARALGLRVVLDLHEAMPELVAARFGLPLTSPIVALARVLETLSAMVAHDIITVNERIRTVLTRRGIPPEKLTVIFNSPFLELVPSAGPKDRLVYSGGLNPERDIGVLIRAFAQVRPALGVPLVLYGRGDPRYLDEIHGLVNALGLREQVDLPGEVPHQRAIEEMARSIVGIVPYERNPLTEVAVPNKVFEFALVRCPLIIADLPALREVFGDSALYYRPGDSDDLAAKIRLASRDGPEGQARIERASRVALALAWGIMEHRLLGLYGESHDTAADRLSAEGETIV